MENNIFLTTDLSVTILKPISPDILFADFYRIYLSDMEGRLKPTTLACKDATIHDRILPSSVASAPMNAISPQIICNWQTALIEQGYRPTHSKAFVRRV